MKYSEIRSSIRSGDLLAWSHRAPWYKSWRDFKISMVRVFTKSEYSHVATAWVVGERVLVIEAVLPLVRIYPLSSLGSFYHIGMNAPWKEETLNYALSQVGEEYSQVQAIQALFSLPKEDSLWECAELARLISLKDGIDLGSTATPNALVQEALDLGLTLRFVQP